MKKRTQLMIDIMKCMMLMSIGLLSSCGVTKTSVSTTPFDFEAHRGGRGLMPENTIQAMRSAVHMPLVQTLEMDVVISKDGKVVVSHDPYFNYNITTTPEGKTLTAQEGQKLVLFQMDYDAIAGYDVGMKPHPDFPRQQKMAAHKPLLTDLIDAAEAEAKKLNRTIHYNIEIKSKKTTDGTHHPVPGVFAEKLMEVLNEKNITERCVVQSFDPRPLQVLHQKYPRMATSFLVDKDGGDQLATQIAKLGFTPAIYSPVYTVVSRELVDACHKMNLRIVPWTVNTKEEIQRLVEMGIDGVISDYPDLFNSIKIKQ